MALAPKVLIVEDNYLLLDMLTSLCKQHGVAVAAASSGEAALLLLRQKGGQIDWLLADINLPGLIDGWTVADAFRELQPGRPVIYTSTEAHLGRRSVPGSLFIRKPFQMREVVALARMMAAGRPGAQSLSDLRAAG